MRLESRDNDGRCENEAYIIGPSGIYRGLSFLASCTVAVQSTGVECPGNPHSATVEESETVIS